MGLLDWGVAPNPYIRLPFSTEDLKATFATIPPPRSKVLVHVGTADSLIAKMKQAGIPETKAEPGFPSRLFGGLAIRELPWLGVTLIGDDRDIESAQNDPASMARIMSIAKGK